MVDDPVPPAQWTTSAWREEATLWLDRELARVGLERIGEVTQPHLEVFTDLVPLSRLRELFEVSCRLAKAARAVIWDGSPQDIDRYLSDVAQDQPKPGR